MKVLAVILTLLMLVAAGNAQTRSWPAQLGEGQEASHRVKDLRQSRRLEFVNRSKRFLVGRLKGGVV